jgi:hypothetical protein
MKLLLLTLILVSEALSAFEISNNNAFLSGLANSTVATKTYPAAYLINPATSIFTDSPFAGISYFRPFSISELTFAQIITSIPLKSFATGLALSTFGTNIYQEHKGTFNLSHSFLKKRLSLGLNFHWFHLSVENYQSYNSWGLDVGIEYEINPHLFSGFVLNNLNQPQINGYPEEIPVIACWGVTLKLDERFLTHFALQKESRYPASLLLGFNYILSPFISIQSGFTTYPAQPTIGCQLHPSILTVYYSFRYHMHLGGTHFWGVSF